MFVCPVSPCHFRCSTSVSPPSLLPSLHSHTWLALVAFLLFVVVRFVSLDLLSEQIHYVFPDPWSSFTKFGFLPAG